MADKLIKLFDMSVKENQDGKSYKIHVKLDMTELTREDLADWCANSSSPKVWLAGRWRAKGEKFLASIAGTTQTVVLPKAGTKTVTITADSALRLVFPAEMVDKLVAAFGSAEKALEAIKANPAAMMLNHEEPGLVE